MEWSGVQRKILLLVTAYSLVVPNHPGTETVPTEHVVSVVGTVGGIIIGTACWLALFGSWPRAIYDVMYLQALFPTPPPTQLLFGSPHF